MPGKKSKTHVTIRRHNDVMKERDALRREIKASREVTRGLLADATAEKKGLRKNIAELESQLAEYGREIEALSAKLQSITMDNRILEDRIGELVYIEPEGPRDGVCQVSLALKNSGIREGGYPCKPGEKIKLALRVRTINSEDDEFSFISGDIINIHRLQCASKLKQAQGGRVKLTALQPYSGEGCLKRTEAIRGISAEQDYPGK